QRIVTLFGADGGSGEARITLWLTAAPPATAARPFSLFLDVEAPPKVAPEWGDEATDVPPPAEGTWWYSRGATLPPQPFVPGDVRGGTGGLRRAGIVRLRVPADWTADGPAVGGVTPYSIFLRTRAATFTYPPAIRRLVPNAAIAAHRRIVREQWRI